jgi:hypothetical protein
MKWQRRALAALGAVLLGAASAAAQQSMLITGGDNVLIRGCVRPADPRSLTPTDLLVWSRGDLVLAGVTAFSSAEPEAIGTTGLIGHVFYWIDDDDDLSDHVGQMVEVRGDLEEFAEGEVAVDRHGDITTIELDLRGRHEWARIPTSWLRGTGVARNHEVDIVARRIDVDEVFVIGTCDLH